MEYVPYNGYLTEPTLLTGGVTASWAMLGDDFNFAEPKSEI